MVRRLVGGREAGMCTACGQLFCGECKYGGLPFHSPNCPTCHAPFDVSDAEKLKRTWRLVHDRSPGRHTRVAQYNLRVLYDNGEGAPQNYTKALKYWKLAADLGYAKAQYNSESCTAKVQELVFHKALLRL